MWTIPTQTKYTHKLRSLGIVVWGIQRALNDTEGAELTEDGIFGRLTKQAVAGFQDGHGLTPDGIFGPASSMRMARSLERTVTITLPDRLIEGFVEGESGGHIGAVNWSVAGGCDCSYLQRRVLDDADDDTIQRAFDGHYQFGLFARVARERFKSYRARAGAHSTQLAYIPNDAERSWRLAALAWNWPYASDRLSRGYYISDQEAPWVPQGTAFSDGTPVETYWDWARFYALGAPEHRDPGHVTRYVRDWTP